MDSPTLRPAVARPLELAPFGVLRVAAWPLEALDSFGCRELLDEGSRPGGWSRSRLAAFEALYAETMSREREALWAKTAGDERFMKALALANPTLLRRVRVRVSLDGAGRASDKRTRHLETTLYRLLARSVGRTVPFGAWCGVGWAEFGETTSVRRANVRRFVAPDLSFYAELLRALASRAAVARRAPYRVNPTLGRRSDGAWGWWSPPGASWSGYATFPSTPELDAALHRMIALDSFTLEEAEEALAVQAHVLDPFFFDQLIPRGLLVGGLQLPPFFSDPWDAIEQIEADLPLPDKASWSRCRGELREICAQIEDAYEGSGCDVLVELGERAAACGARLAGEVGVPNAPCLSLHVDSTAPFVLTMGPELAARLRASVEEDEADISGPMRAFNEGLRRVQCKLLGADGIAVRGLSAESFADTSRADAWHRVPPEEYFPDWPLRTALATLVTGEGSQPAIMSFTLVDDVASPLSRFLPLLSRQDSRAAAATVEWLRKAHRSVGSPELAAIGEVASSAPNAASQPDLGLSRVSLWSASPRVRSLAAARVVGIGARGLVAVELDGRPLAVVSLSAVNLVRGDPTEQLLLMSSLRFPRPPPHFSQGDPRAEPAARPRVTPGDLSELAKQSGVHRFQVWSRCIGNARGRAMVHRGGVPPILIPVDSPLATAALLEGANASWGYLELHGTGEPPFLGDESGRYMAELVVPFRRPTG